MARCCQNLCLFAILVALASCFARSVRAGHQDSGGGDVILCQKRNAAGMMEEIAYLADIYPLRTHPDFAKWNKLPSSVVQNIWYEELSRENRRLEKAVRAARSKIDFSYEGHELPELDDDNLRIDDPDCTKKQLAIQNFRSGKVKVFVRLIYRLSPAQRTLFELHETLIYLRQTAGDTSPLRRDILNHAIGRNFEQLLIRSMGQDDASYHPSLTETSQVFTYLNYEFQRLMDHNLSLTWKEFQKRPYRKIKDYGEGIIFRDMLEKWALYLDVNQSHASWLLAVSQDSASREEFIERCVPRLIHHFSYDHRKTYLAAIEATEKFYHDRITEIILRTSQRPKP